MPHSLSSVDSLTDWELAAKPFATIQIVGLLLYSADRLRDTSASHLAPPRPPPSRCHPCSVVLFRCERVFASDNDASAARHRSAASLHI